MLLLRPPERVPHAVERTPETLLSFHCLMRPAEARQLRWCDVSIFDGATSRRVTGRSAARDFGVPWCLSILRTQQAFAVRARRQPLHGTTRVCFATGRAQIGSGATDPQDLMRALRDTSHLVVRDLCAALQSGIESRTLSRPRCGQYDNRADSLTSTNTTKVPLSASLPVPPLADHTIQCEPPPSLTFRQIRAC